MRLSFLTVLILLSMCCRSVLAVPQNADQPSDRGQKTAQKSSEKKQSQDSKPADSAKPAKSATPESDSAAKKPRQQKKPQSVDLLDVEMSAIDGKKVNLTRYRGNVVLVVNVASKCGFTGQFKELQTLHEKYSEKGLRVIGFPCNQFGKRKKQSDEEINDLCKEKFGVEFDMFAKVDVKGKKQAKLFKSLTSFQLKPFGKGDVKWNFEKFLIDKMGKPIARFPSNVPPNSRQVVVKIELALGIEQKPIKKDDAGKKQDGKDKDKAKTKDNKPAGDKDNKAKKAEDKQAEPNKQDSPPTSTQSDKT